MVWFVVQMYTLRRLHEIGFRLISNTNNDCMAKAHDLENIYLNFIELVFYKVSISPTSYKQTFY